MIVTLLRRAALGRRRCSRPAESSVPVVVGVDRTSPPAAKIALFRSLSAGRDDVYAQRWDNERSGKGGWGPGVLAMDR